MLRYPTIILTGMLMVIPLLVTRNLSWLTDWMEPEGNTNVGKKGKAWTSVIPAIHRTFSDHLSKMDNKTTSLYNHKIVQDLTITFLQQMTWNFRRTQFIINSYKMKQYHHNYDGNPYIKKWNNAGRQMSEDSSSLTKNCNTWMLVLNAIQTSGEYYELKKK